MIQRTVFGLALVLTQLLVPALVWAGPPKLEFPLQCTLGETCFIQQYVDTDPGKGSRDFTCGPLSYDGHKGTDIRLAHQIQIKNTGVNVYAAAAGHILGTRNSMADIAQGEKPALDIAGKECGNGVVIDHGDGWHSQYCHMRQGSIQVLKGQTVKRGEALGLVGLSGLTQFPHLHIKLTKNGEVVDPFNPGGLKTCSGDKPQMWTHPILYRAGGLLSVGFATKAVDFEDIRKGPPIAKSLPSDAPALVLWGFAYGIQKGDALIIRIKQPNGTYLIDQEFLITRNQAEAYRLSGKRRKTDDWPLGSYHGEVTLLRNSNLLAKRTINLIVE